MSAARTVEALTAAETAATAAALAAVAAWLGGPTRRVHGSWAAI